MYFWGGAYARKTIEMHTFILAAQAHLTDALIRIKSDLFQFLGRTGDMSISFSKVSGNDAIGSIARQSSIEELTASSTWPLKLLGARNRSNSFHELRQVSGPSDPRQVMAVSDKQKEQILAAVIKELAAHATAQTVPRVHIITGQMGAGKSTATDALSQALEGDCVVVDYDDLKRFVPGYAEQASKGYPGTVPGCKETARYLVDGLKSHVFDNRLNMIIQESINNRDDEMFRLIKECRENNCRVSLNILAVDKPTSTMGILTRYESGLKGINEGSGSPEGARRTPMEYHEDAYKSLADPHKINRLAAELDEVVVSGRDGKVYYQSATDLSPQKIIDAIAQGRVSGKADPVGMFDKLAGLIQFNVQFSNPELRHARR